MVVIIGCVVIAPVFVAIWHEALPADGPSLGRPAAGVIRPYGGSAIVCEADEQERSHVSRCESCGLLVADEDVVTALELVAEGVIATALKLQESGAMLILPGGDFGVGCYIEALALAGHAKIVIRNCNQAGNALSNLEAGVQCIKGGGIERRLLGCKTAIKRCGRVTGGAVV